MTEAITIVALCLVAILIWAYIWLSRNLTEDPYDR